MGNWSGLASAACAGIVPRRCAPEIFREGSRWRACDCEVPPPSRPHQHCLWEAVALRLAAAAGINTAIGRFERVAGRPVFLLRRFDREGTTRRLFLSAMSMLGLWIVKQSYLKIVDAIQRYGAAPSEDLHELWRRIVFSVLISKYGRSSAQSWLPL
jgi:hypothetical protein